jgi:hypothetical protein
MVARVLRAVVVSCGSSAVVRRGRVSLRVGMGRAGAGGRGAGGRGRGREGRREREGEGALSN